MAGPWEKYAAPPQAVQGPWSKYGQQSAVGEPAPWGGFEGMTPEAESLAATKDQTAQNIAKPGGYPLNLSTAATALQGVPVAGAAIPTTPEMARLQQQYPNTAAGTRMGAAMASTLPLAAMAPGAMGVTGNLGTRLGMSALSGGAIGGADQAAREALAPATGQAPPQPSAALHGFGLPATGNEIANAALFGAGAGAAGTAAGAVGSGLVWPAVRNASQQLYNRGMAMTGGQAAGGMAGRVERGMEMIPFGGVGAERAKSLSSYNRVLENEAMQGTRDLYKTPVAPGSIVTHGNLVRQMFGVEPEIPVNVAPGYEGRQFVRENIQKLYNGAYASTQMTLPSSTRLNLAALTWNAKLRGTLSEQAQTRLAQILDGQVISRFDSAGNAGQPLRGGAINSMDTELRNLEEGYRAGGGDDAALGRTIGDARRILHNELINQNPNTATLLNAADRDWGAYARLRTAAASTKTEGVEGLVSPDQLNQAVFKEDKSFAKTKFGEGEARMQPLAQWGRQVLNAPHGTNAEGYALLGGLAGGVLEGHPALLGVPAALQALYTSPVQRGLSHYLMGGQSWRPQAAVVPQFAGRAGAFVAPQAYMHPMQQALGAQNQQ
jgi:hypothetical protein